MRSKDHSLGTLINGILDGGQGSNNSLVVGDGGAIERNVKVDSDEDSLVLEIEILDGELVGKRHSELVRMREHVQSKRR